MSERTSELNEYVGHLGDECVNDDGYPVYEDGPMCREVEHEFRREACFADYE